VIFPDLRFKVAFNTQKREQPAYIGKKPGNTILIVHFRHSTKYK